MPANAIIIYLCRLYSAAFAIFHMFFWRLFNWKTDLKKITFVNRAIIQIANTRLIYFLLFVAFTCFFYTSDLTETKLGNVFLAGISFFWFGRTIEQFIFFNLKNRVINLLTFIFFIGAILFAFPIFI